MLYGRDEADTKRGTARRAVLAIGALGGLLLLGGSAAVVRAAITDHRVSAADVERMAAQVRHETGFPALGDESVAEALDALVGTPEGCALRKAALARLPLLRETIERELQARHVPKELLALAVFESGLDVQATTANGWGGSAGVWQFIPATARSYGLRVDASLDERLDTRKDSAAAAAFLADLHREFGDWVAAVAAYNMGPAKVRALLAKGGGRPPREVLPPRYVSGVMATLLLLRNPSLVD